MRKTILITFLLFLCCFSIVNAETPVPLNDYMNKNIFINSYNQNMSKLKFPMRIDHVYPPTSKDETYVLSCHPYKLNEKFLNLYTDSNGKIMFISISLNKGTFNDNLKIHALFDITVSLLSLGVPNEYVKNGSEMTKAIDKVLDSSTDEDSASFIDYSNNRRFILNKVNSNNDFLTIVITSSKL